MGDRSASEARVAPIPAACRRALVTAAWAQGPLLALLLSVGSGPGLALVASSSLFALLVGRRLRRESSFALGLTLAMLALGNVGMLAGWAIDAGFRPLVLDPGCLAAAAQGMGWTQGGMLLACLPALVWVRPDRRYLAAAPGGPSRWVGHMLLCPLGMWVGMLAGAVLWSRVPVAELTARVLGGFLAMSGGMALGMLATCHAFDGLATRLLAAPAQGSSRR